MKKSITINYIYNMIDYFSYIKKIGIRGDGYEEDIYSYYIYRYIFILLN